MAPAVSIRLTRTLGGLRYCLGGNRPSETTHQPVFLLGLSSYVVSGRYVDRV